MSQLNPRQREAVKYIDGPLLVLAGAGSGKTSVITRKIAYLIEECGLKAKHIAAVTFTNKAAREMKERVSALVSGPAARGLTVSTFHNLGMNIIRLEHKAVGLKPGFSIFDQQDCKAIIKDLLFKEFDEAEEDVDQLQAHFSNWKNDMLTPAQAIKQAITAEDLTAARLYERYDHYLRAYNAVDFDDLILMPVMLFRNHPEILAAWRLRIRYLLVDEYQDTNLSQYELVQQLVAGRQAFTVVGDDDQSIYAWRGARPENLVRLQKDFPTLKLVKLEQNYRSTARILKAANTLIANNPHVYEKALWSQLGMGDEIRIIRVRNEEAEAERIASEIIDTRLKKRAQYKDFSVLYRGNHQSRLLELKLQAYQIPYRISGGTSFFSRNEIKDAMSYLRLLANPDDDAAFLRVVNVPRREIGPVTLEKLSSYAESRKISLFSAISEFGLESVLTGKTLDHLREFSEIILHTGQKCEEEHDAVPVLKQLFTRIDYEEWLLQNSTSPQQAERRMANVWILLDQVARMLEYDAAADEQMTLKDAIGKLLLRDIMDQQKEEEDEDKVHLLTLHASKGLEFPHVFIMGLEEDILPHRNSIETNQIEEERRLMYVGITRAQRSLCLTFCSERKQFGEKIETIPSRFLDEMPQEDLVWEGLGQRNEERNQARGRATLDALLRDLGD
ncbi:ATP-dependent DNA helicase Rep [Hahella chejuensis KCTC 2396]|uniref:ATP-dependent DNA helicase Rep n=1 Tax=Hahella chejuensis (strain KCTC 2396) TaxID=349521 RepID=Q2S8F2_HAHCH|nr:DNA helicase Rep [Hahella chejuensis]ABC33072.1 ATP-dependent DNA helicase Rep [Hahella chejuensis KCTC 2396]